jgi:hypothetical protein
MLGGCILLEISNPKDLEQETRAYFEEKKVDFVEEDIWREALNLRYQ